MDETVLNLWRNLSAVGVYALRYHSIRRRLDVMQQQVIRRCFRRHTRSNPFTNNECFVIGVMNVLRDT
jgi:hypothetical protein